MRVLLLSTSKRTTAAWLEETLAPLRERYDVEATAGVFLEKPAEPLPLARCLVAGRKLRPGRAVRDVRVKGGRAPARPAPRRTTKWLDTQIARVAPEKWAKDRNLVFASGTVWSRPVRAEFAKADLVVALDWNTTWAAWLLARRTPGPHVVFGIEGALLKLAELDQA